MSIEATTADVGRRVTAKMVQDAQTSGGHITRVLPEGVVYVRWDWQQVQDAPMPTSENLLNWEPIHDGTDEPDNADDDSIDPLALAAGIALVEEVLDGPDEPETRDDSEIEGEGGSFGGGGATADYSDE